MNYELKKWQIPFLVLLVVGTVLIIRQQRSMPYQKNSGFIFGTTYNITYQYDRDLTDEIEAALKQVDSEFSMFNEQSTVARLNRGEQPTLSDMFCEVFTKAEAISKATDGAFDITVAPLVNAWGFGFKHDAPPTQSQVDSLRHLIGYKNLTLNGKHLSKRIPGIQLDFSAIAKGYGVDVISRLLSSHDIQNFMVEIGGEVTTCGINPKRVPWRIGVTKPTDDSLATSQEYQTVLNVTDKSMATSGNYRNFYYRGGRKFAHTIDPRTGYPVQHQLLSATVLAKDCATADAFATSFMVLGLNKAKRILDEHPELMAYLIFSDQHGRMNVWFSKSLQSKIAH